MSHAYRQTDKPFLITLSALIEERERLRKLFWLQNLQTIIFVFCQVGVLVVLNTNSFVKWYSRSNMTEGAVFPLLSKCTAERLKDEPFISCNVSP